MYVLFVLERNFVTLNNRKNLLILSDFSGKSAVKLEIESLIKNGNDNVHQTEGLMTRTMAVHLRCKYLYVSLPSFANQRIDEVRRILENANGGSLPRRRP